MCTGVIATTNIKPQFNSRQVSSHRPPIAARDSRDGSSREKEKTSGRGKKSKSGTSRPRSVVKAAEQHLHIFRDSGKMHLRVLGPATSTTSQYFFSEKSDLEVSVDKAGRTFVGDSGAGGGETI